MLLSKSAQPIRLSALLYYYISGFVSNFVGNKNFVSGFLGNKNFVRGFVSDFVSGWAFLTLPFIDIKYWHSIKQEIIETTELLHKKE